MRLPLELIERLRALRHTPDAPRDHVGFVATAAGIYVLIAAAIDVWRFLAADIILPVWRLLSRLLSSLLLVLAVAGVGVAAGAYFNSTEVGCDGSDANVLFCDDFEADEDGSTANPTWFLGPNGAAGNKGWWGFSTPSNRAVICGAGVTPFGNCAANMGRHMGAIAAGTNYTCGATTVTGLDSTAEFDAASGYTPPTPGVDTDSPFRIGDGDNAAYAITWTGKTATSLTGVTVGTQFGGTCTANLVAPIYVGREGGVDYAEHAFAPAAGNVQEFYLRWYYKPDAAYVFGSEKWLTFNPGALGDGGIFFGNWIFNNAGLPRTTTATAGWYDGGSGASPASGGSAFNFVRGHWHFVELHVKINGAGADGLIEWWTNDCGVDGLSCGPTPILRHQTTGMTWNKTNGAFVTRLWFEGWANFPSIGTEYFDQVKASKVGPIGFAGAEAPAAPSSLRLLVIIGSLLLVWVRARAGLTH